MAAKGGTKKHQLGGQKSSALTLEQQAFLFYKALDGRISRGTLQAFSSSGTVAGQVQQMEKQKDPLAEDWSYKTQLGWSSNLSLFSKALDGRIFRGTLQAFLSSGTIAGQVHPKARQF